MTPMVVNEVVMSRLVMSMTEQAVRKCAREYGFDAEEALSKLLSCGVKEVEVKEVEVKCVKKVKGVKEEKCKKVVLPFSVDISEECCMALCKNRGLYTQCEKKKVSGSEYCKQCELSGKEYGTVEMRLKAGLYDYVDGRGCKPVHYTKVMKKNKITKEEALEYAASKGKSISNEHFEEVVSVSVKRGRPSKEKVVKEKKVKKVEEKEEEEDLFASIVDETCVSDDEEELEELEELDEVESVVTEAEEVAEEVATEVEELVDDVVDDVVDEVVEEAVVEKVVKLVEVVEVVEVEEVKSKSKKPSKIAAQYEAKLSAEKVLKAKKLSAEKALKAEEVKSAKAKKIEEEKAAKAKKIEEEKAAKAKKIEEEKSAKAKKIEEEKAAKAAKALKAEEEKALKAKKMEEEKAAKALKAEEKSKKAKKPIVKEEQVPRKTTPLAPETIERLKRIEAGEEEEDEEAQEEEEAEEEEEEQEEEEEAEEEEEEAEEEQEDEKSTGTNEEIEEKEEDVSVSSNGEDKYKKIKWHDTKYYHSTVSNLLYDYEIYKKRKVCVVRGKFDPKTKKAVLNSHIQVESELTEEEIDE